ncbi:uncharacterized protein [Procambarus clarkii]|uniref:uncharacterized protein n=1 Tax=Procambarus clarkii TaxID=6728 RepID=UPI0037440E62
MQVPDSGRYPPHLVPSTASKMTEVVIQQAEDLHLLQTLDTEKNHSAADLLLNLFTTWHQSLDESKISSVVALDTTGAFERVWHSGLLVKLQAPGVSGSILNK